jgi:hypothetical protein
MYNFIVDYFEAPRAGTAAKQRADKLLEWWNKYVSLLLTLSNPNCAQANLPWPRSLSRYATYGCVVRRQAPGPARRYGEVVLVPGRSVFILCNPILFWLSIGVN